MMKDDKAWFAPKRYGYGTSLPVAWQGWALFIGYVLLVSGAGFLIPVSRIAYAAILLVATMLFIRVCAVKTRGGWRWRWGEDGTERRPRRKARISGGGSAL